MKLAVVLALFALAVARPDGDHYDSKYDDFNIDEVLSNERLLKAYTNCINGIGKCTPEGNDIKKWVPEAVKSSCGKCTDKQKTIVGKALQGIRAKFPEEYAALIKTQDAEGKYADDLKKFIEKYGA